MTEIYLEISKLTEKFRTMAYGLTTDKNKINEAVQELLLYLLQANPDTIKKIYDNDGIEGITRYGAVALRRALRSKRSNFYYKYEKYYTHIDSFNSNVTYSSNNLDYECNTNVYKNISNLPNEEVNYQWTNIIHILTALFIILTQLILMSMLFLMVVGIKIFRIFRMKK